MNETGEAKARTDGVRRGRPAGRDPERAAQGRPRIAHLPTPFAEAPRRRVIAHAADSGTLRFQKAFMEAAA